MMLNDYKTVVITGCSSGFGYDLAIKLARDGHRVDATMRDPDGKNAEAARSLGDYNHYLHLCVLDVTSDASVEAAAATVHDEAGAADSVVNNAGQMFCGITEAFTPDEFRGSSTSTSSACTASCGRSCPRCGGGRRARDER
jgi:NAD(P)-dependent dehydrogenase (short-subunit alcohol dehydrogenase family)